MNTYKITFETCDHKIITGKVVGDDLEDAVSVAKEYYAMADLLLITVVREPKSNELTKENVTMNMTMQLRKELSKQYEGAKYCDEDTLISMLDSCEMTPEIEFIVDMLNAL